MKKIKIKSFSTKKPHNPWYRDRISDVFAVYKEDEWSYIVFKDGNNQYGIVLKEDAEEI